MANEISVNITLTVSKNGTTVVGTCSKSITMAGNAFLGDVQAIGITYEAISFVDTVPGYVFLKNNDATNFIEVALDNAGSNKIAKLLPGQGMAWPTSSATLYAKADTAPCNMQVVAASL